MDEGLGQSSFSHRTGMTSTTSNLVHSRVPAPSHILAQSAMTGRRFQGGRPGQSYQSFAARKGPKVPVAGAFLALNEAILNQR